MTKRELYELLTTDAKCGGMNNITEKCFKNRFPLFYNELCSLSFPNEYCFRQKLYHYLNDDLELKLGLCECGKRCTFVNLKVGYHKYCSLKCSSNSVSVKDKIANTNIERYGVEHPAQCESVMNKMQDSCERRYGVRNAYQSDEIKEKIRATNLERYGVDNPQKSIEIKQRTESTNMERYGCKTPFLCDDVQRKAKETLLERYGVDNPQKSIEIRNKTLATNLEKYGSRYPISTDEVKEKVRTTNLERYGVEYVSQCDDVKEKVRQTNLERYGVEYSMQSIEVKEKARRTNVEKYGVEYACLRPEARMSYHNRSKVNASFEKKLIDSGIEFNMEFPLKSYSYDFKIGSILLEINPTITHNSHISIFGGSPKKHDYHLEKSNCSEANGYFCIHVWDWDDQDKILNMLKPKTALYARNLEIREVGVNDASSFLNAYHLQKTCKGQSVIYGLYMNDILIELMTFGKPRYNKNYEWELLRLCTHCDYKVVGGAERLFKHFVALHNPKSVLSYCDNSKFSGDVYVKLGFELKSMSKPTKHWYNLKTHRHITDNFLRQRGVDQLFGANYGKGTNNEELMLEYGFLPIYDCGQKTFIWSNVMYK